MRISNDCNKFAPVYILQHARKYYFDNNLNFNLYLQSNLRSVLKCKIKEFLKMYLKIKLLCFDFHTC